ncbi:MAG: hypothetical protein MUD12_12165 [Spirochaetes bacterium]|nr:hypothetical protein [Spirochaetota bacterium]
MINQCMLFISSGLLVLWGIAHLFPTKSVVKGFGDISDDNRNIITMEWINEGVTLVFIGAIVSAVSAIDHNGRASFFILWICFFALNLLSVISFFTGFKISFIPFKLCPVIFTLSSVFILLGIYL